MQRALWTANFILSPVHSEWLRLRLLHWWHLLAISRSQWLLEYMLTCLSVFTCTFTYFTFLKKRSWCPWKSSPRYRTSTLKMKLTVLNLFVMRAELVFPDDRTPGPRHPAGPPLPRTSHQNHEIHLHNQHIHTNMYRQPTPQHVQAEQVQTRGYNFFGLRSYQWRFLI